MCDDLWNALWMQVNMYYEKNLPIHMVLDVRDGHRDVGEHRALGLAASTCAAQNVRAQPAARPAAQLVCRWSRTE